MVEMFTLNFQVSISLQIAHLLRTKKDISNANSTMNSIKQRQKFMSLFMYVYSIHKVQRSIESKTIHIIGVT